jgi:hypothetical protein
MSIDQLEEVFTVAVADERAAFLKLLSAALDPEADLPIMALATGRSDMRRSEDWLLRTHA